MGSGSNSYAAPTQVAQSYNNRAVVYRQKAHYEKAPETLGDNDPDMAYSDNNMANLCKRKGAYVSTLVYYSKSLRIKHDAFGDNRSDVAASYNNMAALYNDIV